MTSGVRNRPNGRGSVEIGHQIFRETGSSQADHLLAGGTGGPRGRPVARLTCAGDLMEICCRMKSSMMIAFAILVTPQLALAQVQPGTQYYRWITSEPYVQSSITSLPFA